MANNQNASGKFRPFVISEFRPRDYIHTGGDAATPWRNGMTVMAENHNTAIARHGHVLASQIGTFDPIVGPGPVEFAKYVMRMPAIAGRTTVTVYVTATTTGGTTFQVRGSNTVGTSGWSAATASGSTASVDVTCTSVPTTDDITDNPYSLLTLGFQLSGAGNFLPSEVYIVQTPITTTDIGDYDTNTENVRHIGQDTDQYSTDRALSVASVRELLASQDEHFHQHGRTITNQCIWTDYSTVSTLDDGIAGKSYNADETSESPVMEAIYFPRQGVRRIACFVAARVDGYVATPSTIFIGFRRGFNLTEVGVSISTATTVFTEGSWVVWGQMLAIPEDESPQHIVVSVYAPLAGNTVYLQALAMLEAPDWIE